MSLTRRGSETALRHHVAKDRIWRIIDAKDQVLGRLATQIATILQGKNKPLYFDNMNCGDPIVVINASHFALTGRKSTNKVYVSYSGYPGGQKRVPITQVMKKRPLDVIRLAVRNMLPRNKLRAVWLDNLYLYPDENHNHHVHNPVPVPIAHCSARLGRGGPPTKEELNLWWLNNLAFVKDDTLSKVFEQVNQQINQSTKNDIQNVGLAQVLQFDSESDPSQEDIAANNAYIQAAEQMLNQDGVIVPSTL